MSDLAPNTRRGYLPPMNVPTLSMIDKPVLIIAKTKEDAPENTFEQPLDRVWAGTLESFTYDKIYELLIFKLVGMSGKFQINLTSTNVEVHDK